MFYLNGVVVPVVCSGPCFSYYMYLHDVVARFSTVCSVVLEWYGGASGMFQSLFWFLCSGPILTCCLWYVPVPVLITTGFS